jgi:hypothetical protein
VDVADLAGRYRAVGTAAVFSALEGMGAPTRLLSLEIRPIRESSCAALLSQGADERSRLASR